MSDTSPTSQRSFVGLAFAVFAFAGGLATFGGWLLDIPRLTDWFGVGIAMKANTALAAAIGGAGLTFLSLRLLPWAVRLAGAFVAVVGGLTLLQHLSGWNFGIDLLLIQEPPGARATAAPGRMGPPASLAFLLIGVSLCLLTARARAVAAVFSVLTCAICLLSFTGYLYDADLMYSSARLTGIAFQTVVILAALAVGLLLNAPDQPPVSVLSQRSAAGLFARRFLPVILLLPLTLGWLRVMGEQADLYDSAFGSAMRSVLETGLLGGLLWWAVANVGSYEAARRATQRQLSDVLGSIRDGFVTFDSQMRFNYVNDEAVRLMRRSRDELLGRSASDVFREAVGPSACEGLRQVAGSRISAGFEDYDSAAGRWFATRAYPTADGGVSALIQDVTDRKQAEETLRLNQKALEEADRRKDEFLATLAHELRNPLSPIRSSVELLQMSEIDEETRSVCEIMQSQVDHMVRLVDDLMEVSRITRGAVELRRSDTDLNQVVRRAIDASLPAFRDRGHRLHVELPSEPAFVHGDAVRLTQVFSNLLNNAAKYTDPGGQIWLSAERIGNEILVSIRDDGIGIAEEMLPRIFDMFTQVDRSSRRAQGGLGIGLTLVQRLVAMHDGAVSVQSEGLGKGSEFRVRLPLVSASNESAPASTNGLAKLPARRVLVVDDNASAASALCRLLSAMGSEARSANDGPTALTQLETYCPEIVLLDLGMPGMDGLEVARRIRARSELANVLIVAVTGWGQDSDREKTRLAGFDLHLVKPVGLDAIRETLAFSISTNAGEVR